MSNVKSSEDSEEETSLVKRLWPAYLVYINMAITNSSFFINILIVSQIMWPGEPFHSGEIGIWFGLTTYVMAFSGIMYGMLADKFSRKNLFVFSEILCGIGYIINGFAPSGRGIITFFFFFNCGMIRTLAKGGFVPVVYSFASDSTKMEERSQFFGILQALYQLTQTIGMIISAVFFQNSYWREYLWIVGAVCIIFGLIITLKAKEPKRGVTRKELTKVLSDKNVKYKYKINRKIVKSTILTPTNLIILFEGIFTMIILSIPDFLMIPYIQSPPYNFSPLVTSLFFTIFGLPGGFIGALAFAKVSDKLAKRNIKNRVFLIVFSIMCLYIIFLIIFNLPWPHLTVEEGKNFFILFAFPAMWVMGFLVLTSRTIMGFYNINQPPILQDINLPETQGIVSSLNQFLELIGSGTGVIIAGTVLALFNYNYQLTSSVMLGLGIIGALWWLFAAKWINKDANRISDILNQRSAELSNEKNREG